MTGVACRSEGCNFIRIVVGAIERVALSNSEVTSKRWARFGDADDLHIVLCINCICDPLTDGSVSVDGDFDGHDLLHALLMKAVNKGFFTARMRPASEIKIRWRSEQQCICVRDTTMGHGGCFRGRLALDEHQRKIGPSPHRSG